MMKFLLALKDFKLTGPIKREFHLVAEIANVFAALIVIAGSGRVGQTIVVFLVDHIVVVIVVRGVTGVLLLVASRTVPIVVAVVSGKSGCSCDSGGRRGNSIRVMVIVAVVMRMLLVVLVVFVLVVHSDGCRSCSG